jgi:GTPase involved in cell partitioning and DNA repair
LLLQVVDASAADPGTDYLAVREELRMYNPEYVTRPHVVALNKVDLEDAGALAFQGDGFTFIGT